MKFYVFITLKIKIFDTFKEKNLSLEILKECSGLRCYSLTRHLLLYGLIPLLVSLILVNFDF